MFADQAITAKSECTCRKEYIMLLSRPSVFSPEDGSSAFLRNTKIYRQVHTALQHRRPNITTFNAMIKNLMYYTIQKLIFHLCNKS
jgi:hypothetical protein